VAIGGVGQAATNAALVAAGGDNAAIGLTLLRRSLDVSESSTGQLLASLPDPDQKVGRTLDLRL
jgi:hypothetical protein